MHWWSWSKSITTSIWDTSVVDTFFAYLTHLQLIFDSFIFSKWAIYFRKCKHIIIVTTKILSSIWMTQMWKSIGKLHSISSWPKVFFLLPFLIKTWNRRTVALAVKKHNDKTFWWFFLQSWAHSIFMTLNTLFRGYSLAKAQFTWK